MRITFIITDLHLGGSPRILADLAKGLTHLAPGSPGVITRIESTIISLKPFPPQSHSSFDPSLFEFDSSFVINHSSLIKVHSLNLTSLKQLPRAIPRLARLLNQLKPDIVYSILIHANLLTTLALPFVHPRPTFIQSIHTLQEKPAWHWTLQGMISQYADALIVPSQPILEKIATHGSINKGIVIPNGIDVDRFARAQPFLATELPWPAGARVVGYVGRFDPVKNLPTLLRAFGKLTSYGDGDCGGGVQRNSPLHLALVGYGTQENELRELTNELHIAPLVHFLGATSVPERWYKSFTVHVLPSSIEGFGLTLVESLAAGIPVIAPETAVTRSIVQPPSDGLLLHPFDEFTLASAITELTNRPPLSPDFARLKSAFSTAQMVARHAEIFKDFFNYA